MLDCAASNLLGSVEDRRAYPPPEAVHRANAEATMRRSRASIHDGSPLAQNALAVRTNRADQLMLRTTTHRTASISPPFTQDSRPVLPLSIKSTYFGKTSIEGKKNLLSEIDGHPSLKVTTLSRMLMREER